MGPCEKITELLKRRSGGEEEDVPEDVASFQPKKKKNTFEKLGLSEELSRLVIRRGFSFPTPIQRRAIPVICSGADVIAMARTGSGKTAAYVLPAIDKLKSHGSVVGIRSVFLVPTRELAFQVSKVVESFCKGHSTAHDLRTCVIVGGTAMTAQFEQLANNPDIVVAVPGRLMHLLVECSLKLAAVEYLVIDEADQMFELGLGEQLGHILKASNRARQTIMTSATLPKTAVDFAMNVGLRDPQFIRLDAEDTLPERLKLWFLYSRTELKLLSLVYLLKEVLDDVSILGLPPGVIVFVASRFHCDLIATFLQKAQVKCSTVYGAMDQEARQSALVDFKKGTSRVLVVTDVGARGIDIPQVGTVVNYDFPSSPKHFVHRVGRTARAGRSGLAISLLTRDEIAYALEVLLFVGLEWDVPGIKVDAPDDTISLDATLENDAKSTAEKPKKSLPALGALPDVSTELHHLAVHLKEDPELVKLQQLVANATKQYLKSRREASKQSIRRAKDLLHAMAVSGSICLDLHPELADLLKRREKNVVEEDPKTLKLLAQLRATKSADTAIRNSKSGRKGGVLPATVVAKMRTRQSVSEFFKSMQSSSAPERKRDLFDWKARALSHGSSEFISVDSSVVDEQAAIKEQLFAGGAFASAGRNAPSEWQALRTATFDLEDDAPAATRVRQVKKWNPRTKKFVMTNVDDQGAALRSRDVKRRNEAGVIIRGELKPTGIYKKWSKQTKRIIPATGLAEGAGAATSISKPRKPVKKADKGNRGAVVVDELKGAAGVLKKRAELDKKRAEKDKDLRKKLAKKAKAKHMRKRKAEAESKGAPRRSFIIGNKRRIRKKH